MLGSNTASQLGLVELVAVLGLRDTLALGHALELLKALGAHQVAGRLVRGLLLGLTAGRHVVQK